MAGECEIRDDLGSGYRSALEKVKDARRELDRAYTQLQAECAATKLYRVEAHRQSVVRELAAHCREHGCSTPEIEEMLFEPMSKRAAQGCL